MKILRRHSLTKYEQLGWSCKNAQISNSSNDDIKIFQVAILNYINTVGQASKSIKIWKYFFSSTLNKHLLSFASKKQRQQSLIFKLWDLKWVIYFSFWQHVYSGPNFWDSGWHTFLWGTSSKNRGNIYCYLLPKFTPKKTPINIEDPLPRPPHPYAFSNITISPPSLWYLLKSVSIFPSPRK